MAAKTNNTKSKRSPSPRAKPAAKASTAGKARVAAPQPLGKLQAAKPSPHKTAKAVAAKTVPGPHRKPAPVAVKAAHGAKPLPKPAPKLASSPVKAHNHHAPVAASPAHARPHAPAGHARPVAQSGHVATKPPVAHAAHAPHAPHAAPKPAPAVQAVRQATHPAPGQANQHMAPSLPPRPVLAPGHRPAGHGPSLSHKRSHGFGHNQPGQLPRDVIERNPTLKLDPNKKKTLQRHGFRTSEFVVYPSHGVGKIVAIEEQVVAGHALELCVINFEQEKMTLRVPTAKLAAVGMRKLSEDGIVRRAMETLKGRARIKRTMWSRRAQEYETKINSGDLVSISEVVRDLYRAETQPEQSYSERQLFEAALDRMSREIAAIEKLDERGAVQKITEVLSKSAKGRAASKAAAEEAAIAGGEAAGEGQAA